ncbi:acyl-CoA Delta(11) desaturase-like [Epargyreus clarus]|uniref:acyl-CoA Delta(11) desaturase-like n=1 Tax=Epargyreus clarus TaxID=520877 RepID=UPI003C2BD1A0
MLTGSNSNMAPSTITETSLLKEPLQNEICSKFEPNCETDHTFERQPNTHQRIISPYYDETLSPTDPKFLAGIRKWEKNKGFVTSIKWTSAVPILLFHIITIGWSSYTLYNGILPKWQTGWFAFLLGELAGFGVTAGAHRYWTHRSFKAKLPLQIFLLFCYSIAGQNNLYNWVRDHRLHHKMSETSADPHNVHRGFFFSHIGWLMMKKHPHVLKEGAKIDMSDIANDPLLKFYNKHFNIFKLLFCMTLPVVICVVCWDESWIRAIQIQTFIRYLLSLNFTWSVNSFAHLWGCKPYDRSIMPVENFWVSIVASGEGWHNYHHTFPWDYKAAELPYYVNLTTIFLDMFAKIGWAYDMKQASPSLIQSVIENRSSTHSH